MIVLDEQLLGYGLQESLARWYRGTITDITQLRPGTVIEDDAIPSLLRTAEHPTFVTINVKDFWRRLEPDHWQHAKAAVCEAPAERARRRVLRVG